MSKKLLAVFSAIMVLSMVLSASAFAPAAPKARSVADLSMFKTTKFDAHYVVPKEGPILNLLEKEEAIPIGNPSALRSSSVQDFIREFVKRNPDTAAPHKLKELLDQETRGFGHHLPPVKTDRSIKSLVTLVEFPAADSWTAQVLDADGNCVDTPVAFTGPLHNQIAPPGPRDNNTVWYNDTTPTLYNEMYFGEGPKAGVIVNHPNLGRLDFRGKTMVNYYLEQSGNKFAPSGEVYPKWFQAAHTEAWYGEDGCLGSHNIRAQDLVKEVIDQVKADSPAFNWQSFDGNADGVVDNFTVIHAGAGQEAGGGAQGDFAIWSHASMIGWPDGYLACEKGAAGCPDRNIYVREYSMDPENIDLGVIAEEFGHAAFGLPDIYTTDAQGSPSNWAIMESGSWNGILGGMEPAPFPLWFRYLLGWADVKEISYDSPPTTTVVGQLSKTPAHLYSGLKINLPSKEVTVPNPLNTGKARWSNVADAVNYTLTRSLDLTGTTAPVFSFESYWSIETEYDYGYVEVSTDNGATWTMLKDTSGFMTTDNPYGNNLGVGLTGIGTGTLTFDLSPYAGKPVQLQLVYATDSAVQFDGWWGDSFKLADGGATLWSDDAENGDNGWIATGWTFVPFSQVFPRFYLAEWRNNSGFDQGLKYPYATVYSSDTEWEVDRAPYTVPGMLLWFRDTSYAFDYTLYDSINNAPSIGPKHALLVVDSHYWPYEWNDYTYASGANLRVNARVQPGNATFTLQPTTPFTLRLGFDPATGIYQDTPVQTKKFGPLPAVSSFHDSLGYYPGFTFNGDGYVYYWDKAASMVLPAKGNYSTRITGLDKQPLLDLYGADMGGGQFLGSGNPGDDAVQYGLHIAVVTKPRDGSWGLIQTWNSADLEKTTLSVDHTAAKPGEKVTFKIKVKNTTPAMQKISLAASIPANTTFVSGRYYDKKTNAILWDGSLFPREERTLVFEVKINKGVASGTVINAAATVTDDALGSAAQTSLNVK
jgi:immune inhibitor A